ncbi:MAG TPA: beta-ketoacyl-ACP synthase [Xanthobacteraceae bacterium]|nr:beta-ketoacyl-ACP synthase [Xanthobacteraceae bacterium]
MAEKAAEPAREAWITGVGVVSTLGEGPRAHWQGLNAAPGPADVTTWAPFVIHPVAALDLDKQIPKKGDQRQMEAWQRIGTYAAGLALDSAGVKGNAELLARMDMIVAAGGGERDAAVDAMILSGLRNSDRPETFLNERLMNDLRPTLFLAQLSNLVAGNISIVHGVTGSSRTFMGEESAGVDAIRVALARIAAGQSRIALVGGSANADQISTMLLLVMGHRLWRGEPRPLWERAAAGGGMASGSLGAFLVIEEKSHALARAATPFARLSAVLSGHAKRTPGAITAMLDGLWERITPSLDTQGLGIISGATGAEPATAEERAFLAARAAIAMRTTGSHLGHGVEAQFPMNVALAALALQQGRLFASSDPTGFERAMDAPLRQVAVTSVGHWRGEGLGLLEAVR